MNAYQAYSNEQIQRAIELLNGDSFCRHLRENLELELVRRNQELSGEEFEEEFRN